MFPVSAWRRLDVHTTLIGRQRCCYDVETTLCILYSLALTVVHVKNFLYKTDNVKVASNN